MILKLIKIYFAFFRFSFSKASEFRFDSLFRIIMDIAFVLQFYLLLDVTFDTTTQLAGWGREQAMLFFALYLVIDALYMVFIDPNMENLGNLVVKGGFDYYLLRPTPTLFQVLLREISLPSLTNLMIACGIFCYTLSTLSIKVSSLESLLIVGLIANGLLLITALRLIFALGVFWGMSERSLLPVSWAFSVMFEKPHVIYKGVIKFLGLSLLPYALSASIPAEILSMTQDTRWFHLTYLAGISVAFYFITLLLWSVALKNYSSASS